MEKNEGTDPIPVGGNRRQSGYCREKEKGIRVSENLAFNVSVSQTQGRKIKEETFTSYKAQSHPQKYPSSSGNRVDGKVLGTGSGLGLLHSGRRSNPVQGREVHRSNRCLPSL